MTENRTKTTLETFSQALVVGAGLLYLFGFVIVSIFDASYGVADFSLFRTKVLAVGTLFVFLLSLPVLLTFRMFGIFGLRNRTPDPFTPSSPRARVFHFIDVALYIPFACTGIAWLVVFLFPRSALWRGKGFSLFLLTSALVAVPAVLGINHFNKHPLVFVLMSLVADVFLFVVLFKYTDRAFFWIVAWFVIVAVVALLVSHTVKDRENLKHTQRERVFLSFVPLIFGVYAFKVYPQLRHEVGGGVPVSIVLHLTKKLPPFDSEIVPVSLIDETEQGYYVLRGSDKAVFVARGLVEAVEFLRSGQTTQTVPAKP